MNRALALTALLTAVGGGAARADPAEFPWRVDLAAAHSDLTGGRAGWTDATAALTYRPDVATWLTASLEHAQQFGLSDDVFGLHAARRLSDGWSGGLGLAASPAANFRAHYQLQANALSPEFWRFGSWGLALGVDGSLADYRPGLVKSVQPVLVATSRAGPTISVRLIETWDEFNRRLDGYALRAEFPLAKRVRILVGYADAPESDLGVTVPTRAANAGLMVDVSKTTTLRIDGVREVRPTFDRTEVSVAVTRLF